jgi:hypothetical protein
MDLVPDIRIARGPHVFWDMNLVYDVVVDDQVVGALWANRSFSCSVSSGHHRIQVKCNPENEMSNVVEVNLEPDHTTELACSTRPGMATFNPLLVGRLFHLRLQTTEPQNGISSDR